jgi:hypothetical protein
MKDINFTIACVSVVFSTINLSAQQPVGLSPTSGILNRPAPESRGWTDPALNHNRLLQQKLGEGTYVMIGNFKVKGTPYLFGGNNNADLFTQTEKAYNINVSYNTYNQEVAFVSTSNLTTPLVKEAGEVDSFVIKQNIENGIPGDIRFVYGKILGSSDKTYFQEVAAGAKYSLYKRYKSDLGQVSDNYIQSDLRQFDLMSDYFYYDNEKKTLKKFKLNHSAVLKEFKTIKDVSPVADREAFSASPEDVLKKVFAYLNS